MNSFGKDETDELGITCGRRIIFGGLRFPPPDTSSLYHSVLLVPSAVPSSSSLGVKMAANWLVWQGKHLETGWVLFYERICTQLIPCYLLVSNVVVISVGTSTTISLLLINGICIRLNNNGIWIPPKLTLLDQPN